MDVNARVEQLERENRRMKKIGIVSAVVVSAVTSLVSVAKLQF